MYRFLHALPRLAVIGCAGASVGCVPLQYAEELKRLQSGLEDLRSFQAEQTVKISALEAELRQLSGKTEELEFAQNRKLGSDVLALRDELNSIKGRVPPPANVPLTLLEADERRLSTLPPEISPVLTHGLKDIREGRFGEALTALSEALQIAGATPLAVDVQFWLGVAHEGANDPRKAVELFHTIVSESPKHPKAPAALLKEASVMIRLGDSKVAKLGLNKLITSYPKAPEAARAKEMLKDL